MKLLMVDDNVPFLEGMVRSVDWEQFGVIDDVLTAYSMKQAMEILAVSYTHLRPTRRS